MSLRVPTPGLVVAGKYRLAERLGGGGMGEVFRAENMLAGRPVALKLLRGELAEDKDLTRRFFQEAQAANKISHPCIVDVIDAGFAETGPYIAMELLDGESTAAALARLGRLPLEGAVAVGLAVLSALDAAHRAGIIHRDLKPENVYLHRAPSGVSVKLLDFGIAKVLEPIGPTPRTHTGVVFGTPDYLSPEQATGEGVLDGRSDLFAVGVLLFELITGERPFRAATAVATAYKVVHAAAPAIAESGGPEHPVLEAVVARAMRKRPEERYAMASDFARELELVAPDPGRRAESLAWILAATGPDPARLVVASTPGASPHGPTQPADGVVSRGRRLVSPLRASYPVPPPSPGPIRAAPIVHTPPAPPSGPREPRRAPIEPPPRLSGVDLARISSPDLGRPPDSGSTLAAGATGRPHVRGSVLRAIDKAIAFRYGSATRERIVERLPASCADDFRHHSVTGLVLYELGVFEAYAAAAADFAIGADVARWREIGRAGVEGDLATLLRPLARCPDELTLVRRGVGLWSRLFDFGVWNIRTDAPPFLVRVSEIAPAPVALRHWLVGLVEQSVRASGFAAAIVTPTPPDLAHTPELELVIDPGPRR